MYYSSTITSARSSARKAATGARRNGWTTLLASPSSTTGPAATC